VDLGPRVRGLHQFGIRAILSVGKGGRGKENTLIHISGIRAFLSYIAGRGSQRKKEDRVLKLCDDCCKVHNSQ
jgi:hypothetical protein